MNATTYGLDVATRVFPLRSIAVVETSELFRSSWLRQLAAEITGSLRIPATSRLLLTVIHGLGLGA